MATVKVLIVDDDEEILFALQKVFRKERCECIVARDGEEALLKAAGENPTLIFMDITMPKLNGLEALRRLRETNKAVPVVIITGYGTMQRAVTAVQCGAFEYLTKPLDVEKIREVTRRAVAMVGSVAANDPLPPHPAAFKAEVVDRCELIGNGARMQEVYKFIGSVSMTPNHMSVLILGESGTGKELVARAIHSMSSTSREPFVAINCTALPEALLESELFGHERGTFTGAIDRKIGKFEVASAGSIFLDEIGNLSMNLQQKLLRVLQEHEFERLGGTQSIPVRARFIAATNRDVESEVKRGTFREDLFYRLNVATIQLPPLRDRMEDVPLLANYFLARSSAQMNRNVNGFSSQAMEVLQSYSYPGNVRELENLIERAVMLTKGEVVLPDALRNMSVSSFQAQAAGQGALPVLSESFIKSRDHLLQLFENQFITEMLRLHRGNVARAAKASQVTRQYFQRLMQKHGIQAKSFRS